MRPASRTPRRPRPAASAAWCAALLLAAATPADAHAQFGRLRDAAAAAARGAAKAVAPAAGDGATASAVAFTGDVLEITEARLAQLVRGLDAEVAARPAAERELAARRAASAEATRTFEARLAAYERERAAWRARRAARDTCVRRAGARHAGAHAALKAEGEATYAAANARLTGGDLEARVRALGERARAAHARGDRATMMAVTDSMQRIVRGEIAPAAGPGVAIAAREQTVARAEAAEVAACGDLAPEPAPPKPGEYVDGAGAAREAREAGERAAGLAPRQYAVLRERVEEYARRDGRTDLGHYRFTAGELRVLGGRRAALRGHAALVADGRWTVSDAPSGW